MMLRFWSKVKFVGPSPLPQGTYTKRGFRGVRFGSFLSRLFVWCGIFLVLFGFFIVMLYRVPGGERIVGIFSGFLPLPALEVGDRKVRYAEYSRSFDSWKSLLELRSGEEVSDDVVRAEMIDRMVLMVELENFADELGVEVSDEDFDDFLAEFVAKFDNSAQFEAALFSEFGWDEATFVEFFIRPVIYERVLSDAVLDCDECQSDVRSVIEGIHIQASEDRSSVGLLAVEKSSSLSSSEGGELGMRSIGEYPADARSGLLTTSIDGLTSVFELKERFVFYQVLERDERWDGIYVNAREISLDKKGLFDILGDGGDVDVVWFFGEL